MQDPESHYNELHAMSDYVWRHHHDLISSTDKSIEFVMQFRLKTNRSNDREFVRNEIERFTKNLTAEQIETSKGDLLEFREKIAARIIDTRGDEIKFNRCPSCNRIVRTPKAQQCFWCGHDWH